MTMETFANHLPADVKLSKIQTYKIIQFGGFLGKLLESSMKIYLPLMKNVIKPLARKVCLILLGLTPKHQLQIQEVIKKFLILDLQH